jgi:HEPN domain-containing protein
MRIWKEEPFMPNPSPETINKVMQWLAFADDDLETATYVMGYNSGAPYRIIAFHAQQCAEKCLKAYLVYHNVDFPYTHNIRRLLKLCNKYANWPHILEQAKELTPYAITARYPGEDEEVSEAEAKKAIDIAQQVRNHVRIDLKKLGLNLSE